MGEAGSSSCRRITFVLFLLAAIGVAAWIIYQYGFNQDDKKDPLRSCTERAGTVFNGTCYFSPNTTASWQNAENFCDQQGGHLASIPDASHNAFALSLVTKATDGRAPTAYTWFGLNDLATPFSFVYPDGAAADFTYWAPEKPSNPRLGRNCVSWASAPSNNPLLGRWNDRGCDEINHYVCKFSIPSRPSVPTALVGTIGGRRLTYSCTFPKFTGGASINRFIFNLYDSSNPNVIAAQVNSTNCAAIFTGLSPAKSYFAQVRAVNPIGVSAASASSTTQTPRPEAPAAPTGLVARAGADAATLSWVPPADNGGAAVKNYTMRVIGATTTVVNVDGQLSSVGVTLAAGTYTFDLVANNDVGSSTRSAASNSVTVVATSPRLGRVTGVTAAAGPRRATVSWTGLVGVTSYTILTTTPGVNKTGIDGASTSANVTGLANGVEISFGVYGTNANGDGMISEFSAYVTPTADDPTAPLSPTVTAGVQAVTVGWAAPADNGGEEIIRYVVDVLGSDSSVKTTNVTAPAVSTTVLGLSTSLAYNATIRAVNAAGRIGPSAVAPGNVVPTTGPPSVPQNVVATGGAVLIAVTWDAPVNDGGVAITNYTVTCTPGGYSVEKAANARAHTFTDVPVDTPRSCSVSAANGNGFGAAATAANTTSFASTPLAFTGLTSVAVGQGISISYTIPTSLSFRGGLTLTTLQGSCYLLDGDNNRLDVAPVTVEKTAEAPGTSATIVVSKLAVARTYDCVLAAANTLGYGVSSDAQRIVAIAGIPDPPTGLLATAADSSASVSWRAPTENGGEAVSRYFIQVYRVGQSVADFNTSVDGTKKVAVVTGLKNGQAYFFRGQSQNSAGLSALSVQSNPIEPSDGSVLNKAGIIGGVIGAIVLIVLCIVGMMWHSESGCFKPDTESNIYKEDSSANLTLQPTMSSGPTTGSLN